MASIKKVNVTDLLINTENYRYESVENQKEAIDKIIADQGNKLYNLAESIIKYGLNPNETLQVYRSPQDPTKYIVLEGNRRIVALKLLLNPELIEDSNLSSLKLKFEKLSKEYKKNLVYHVDCNCYDDPKEADYWIAIKHGSGNEGVGTERWNAHQRARFEQKTQGKTNLALDILSLLKESSYIPKELRDNLKNVKLTSLDRLVADPQVKEFLGIEYSKGTITANLEEKEVMKGLEKIARDCLDPNFKVKTIYNKADRRTYLDSFPASSRPSQNTVAEKPWIFTENKIKSINPNQKIIKVIPKDRKILIPKSCKLEINIPKINDIYHELRRVNLENFTNATAVLLRVFVELSIDAFLEKKQLAYKKDSGRSKLRHKVSAVADYLEKNSLIDKNKLKGIRTATSNDNSIMGIDTWHAYLHNKSYSPTPQYLRTTWNNIQDFIEKLWENMV